MEIINAILDFLQNNQLLMTIFGVGGMGTLFYWLKGIPSTIFYFLKREFTTEMTISSQHLIFYNLLKYY